MQKVLKGPSENLHLSQLKSEPINKEIILKYDLHEFHDDEISKNDS